MTTTDKGKEYVARDPLLFCPNCDSMLDISKSTNKKVYNIENTPSDVTDTDEDKISNIIDKLLKNEAIDAIENIKMDQIINHEAFQKLDKAKRSSVMQKLEALFVKQDDSTIAYYACKTCSFSKKIDPGTRVASKIGTSTQTNYLNSDKFKNKIHNRALRFTRNFICPNKDCPGERDPTKHEAIMYRIGETMQMGYTCTTCLTIFGA